MNIENDSIFHRHMPEFIADTMIILQYLQELNYNQLKSIWKCSDKLARLNYDRVKNMDISKNLSPAILSFEGIQYQYMGTSVFTDKQLDYLDQHLRILSGFYGILKPFDGIVPYRLEMGSKFNNWKYKSLYDFWGDKIGEKLFFETDFILDLASKEYSRVISKYLPKDIRIIECIFGEIIEGKVKEKATYAKMARGEMVRFMAENQIKELDDIKYFDRLGYIFKRELSDENKYIFTK